MIVLDKPSVASATGPGIWVGFSMMCVGMFMTVLGVQVVATSLPTIRKALGIAADRNSGGSLSEVGQGNSAAWLRRFAPRIHAGLCSLMRPSAVTMLLPIFKQLPALLTVGASVSGKTWLPLPGLSRSSSNAPV